jgi:catechol 2,3-dioxygenase-like lactoylglutathione lyase family enzyme
MWIGLTSVPVDDQEKARQFYTEKLGFVLKVDQPVGDDRWLTVVSPEGSPDTELLLEPMGLPAARTYQKALYEAGIPATSFMSNNIAEEFERLRARGVCFTVEPTKSEWGTYAVFDDTCGNLISVAQVG